MANAARFLFNTDFRKPPAAVETIPSEAIGEAEARGYMRGLIDGQRQGEVEAQAHLAAAMERIAAAVTTIMTQVDQHQAETEALAMEFAMSLARKLAGEAVEREPLGAIATAAAEAFRHLRAVPHLVVRVNEGLVEAVDLLMKRLARERGFDGRLVILGEPDLAPGDVHLEWADGGIVRDQSRIEQAVATALTR